MPPIDDRPGACGHPYALSCSHVCSGLEVEMELGEVEIRVLVYWHPPALVIGRKDRSLHEVEILGKLIKVPMYYIVTIGN